MKVLEIGKGEKKKKITVAKLGDKEIQVETPMSAGLFLEFMEKASENDVAATIFILKGTLGDDQYELLKNAPGLTFQDLSALAQNILEVVTEGVK